MELQEYKCPCCGHVLDVPAAIRKKLSKRKVVFTRNLVTALVKALVHCRNHKTNQVQIRELKLKNAEYARMNDLVRFGLAYKREDMKAGEYGIPRKRADLFLRGEWAVASHFWHNPVDNTNEMSEERIFVSQVPRSDEIIAWYGEKFSEYKD